MIDNIPIGGSLVVSVRKKAVSNAPASLDKVFTIYPRPGGGPNGAPKAPGTEEMFSSEAEVEMVISGASGFEEAITLDEYYELDYAETVGNEE